MKNREGDENEYGVFEENGVLPYTQFNHCNFYVGD